MKSLPAKGENAQNLRSKIFKVPFAYKYPK